MRDTSIFWGRVFDSYAFDLLSASHFWLQSLSYAYAASYRLLGHMPRPKRRRILGQQFGQGNWHDDNFSDGDSHDENTPPDDPELPTGKPKTLKAQLIEKDAIIANLEAIVSELEADLLQLRMTQESLEEENQNLSARNLILSLANKSLNTLKRKAETSLTEELTKKHKRVRRLEREREDRQEKDRSRTSTLQHSFEDQAHHISQLELDLTSAKSHIQARDSKIISLQTCLREKQSTLTATRQRLYGSQRQVKRSKSSLKEVEKAYRNLRTWDPIVNGQYSAASRELARNLTFAGCSAAKVEFAVNSCARTFGIKVRRRFMSRRSVGRAIDEGGKYGEIQLGREIMDAPGISLCHTFFCYPDCCQASLRAPTVPPITESPSSRDTSPSSFPLMILQPTTQTSRHGNIKHDLWKSHRLLIIPDSANSRGRWKLHIASPIHTVEVRLRLAIKGSWTRMIIGGKNLEKIKTMPRTVKKSSNFLRHTRRTS